MHFLSEAGEAVHQIAGHGLKRPGSACCPISEAMIWRLWCRAQALGGIHTGTISYRAYLLSYRCILSIIRSSLFVHALHKRLMWCFCVVANAPRRLRPSQPQLDIDSMNGNTVEPH